MSFNFISKFLLFFGLLSLLFHVSLKAAVGMRFVLENFFLWCSHLNDCNCSDVYIFLIFKCFFPMLISCLLDLFVASFYLSTQSTQRLHKGTQSTQRYTKVTQGTQRTQVHKVHKVHKGYTNYTKVNK